MWQYSSTSKRQGAAVVVKDLPLTDLWNLLANGRVVLVDTRPEGSGPFVRDAFVLGDFETDKGERDELERLQMVFDTVFPRTVVVFGETAADERAARFAEWMRARKWVNGFDLATVYRLQASAQDVLNMFSFLACNETGKPALRESTFHLRVTQTHARAF